MSSAQFDSTIYTRTKSSYVNEWIGHNRMHDLGRMINKKSWIDSAEHVDMDNLENRMILWDILSFVS